MILKPTSVSQNTNDILMVVECCDKIYTIIWSTISCYYNGFWSKLPALLTCRRKASVISLHHYLIIIGGEMNGQPVLVIEVYDTITHTSNLLSDLLPASRYQPSLIEREGFVYVFGGGIATVHKIDFSHLIPEASANASNSTTTPVPTAPPHPDGPESCKIQNGNDKKLPANTNTDACLVIHPDKMMVAIPVPPRLPEIPSSTMTTTTLKDRIMLLRWHVKHLEHLQQIQQEQQKKYEQHVLEYLQGTHRVWNEDVQHRKQEAMQLERQLGRFLESALTATKNDRKSSTDQRDGALHNNNDNDNDNDNDKHDDNDDNDMYCDGIPSFLRCPITLELMKDPVVASDGNIYERVAITRWFQMCLNGTKDNPKIVTSPATGEYMKSMTLFPCHSLKSVCQSHAETIKEKHNK
eukprot:CAMPEP_0202442588 /NCGR_PEP_ID=MMETSP1360-20130828/1996_1 /ASSEMBLY_ACC=CAM_ASM_000848 /TAXON_ID=515479 /ORGANISM="Licmophora paradoxa, Strain CCMP2313" /LENGTH=408 /DNA_ID=CAMNT_0049057991 /DNA_START=401 /DNA_END=1627 /DNA_ORIENTATION=-